MPSWRRTPHRSSTPCVAPRHEARLPVAHGSRHRDDARRRGVAAPPDAALAETLAPAFDAAPPHPDIGEYVRCLGNLLGADIHLCTEFGLNVHGKGFYLVPFDIKDVRLISGRNVHQRLVQFVGERHRAWAGRQQAGGGALSLTLDGAPVAVAADGAFAVTTPLPPGGTARLALATAAGDVTTIPVPGRRFTVPGVVPVEGRLSRPSASAAPPKRAVFSIPARSRPAHRPGPQRGCGRIAAA